MNTNQEDRGDQTISSGGWPSDQQQQPAPFSRITHFSNHEIPPSRPEEHGGWSYVGWPQGGEQFYYEHGSHEGNPQPAGQEMRDISSDRLSRWEPLYLKRWVLLGFSLIFVALLVSLQVIFVYSRDHSGLTSTSQRLHYIWTYAPTAVFTLVSALWVRVEYQAKLVAPWANMAKESKASQHTIHLDYVSMVKIFSIFPAFKNKDYHVAFASIVSISLQLSIILSTGLLILVPTEIQTESTPIPVQSQFVNSTDGIKAINELPALITFGHRTSELPYPLGLSDEIAYQLPGSDIPQGTTESLNVEGFSTSLDCEHIGDEQFIYAGNSSYSVTSRAWPNCTTTVFLSQSLASTLTCLDNGVNFIGSILPVGCSKSDSLDDQRILALWGNTVCPVPSPQSLSFKRVAVLLCRPKYAIRNVEVVYTAGEEETVKINHIAGATERQLSAVHPWDIAQAQFELTSSSLQTDAVAGAIATQLQADIPMAAALSLYANDTVPYIELLDTNNLDQMVRQYYTRIGAAIGHVGLTSFSNDTVTGSRWINQQRLQANSLPVQFITGLLVLSLAMSIALVALMPQEKLILLHNPGSIIGIATHIYQSRQLIEGLRGEAASSDKSLREHTKDWKIRISRSDNPPRLFLHVEDVYPGKRQTRNLDQWTWLQPLIIQPVSRILICLLMIILILTLELLLRESEAHNGLAAISSIDSLHYLWTWLPTFVMVLVGLLVGAIEFAVICYSPFWHLKSKMAIKFLDSNFLDSTRPALIAKALQTRSLAIVLATVAVILSTFLNIFTASLFVPKITSTDTMGSLKILETFTPVNTLDDFFEVGTTMDLSAALILTQNLSFPAMTTEELIIPKVELAEPVDMKNASIKAQLPALRTSMECTAYQPDEMKIHSGPSDFYDSPTVNITFPRTEMCIRRGESNETMRFPAYLQTEDYFTDLKNDTMLGLSAAGSQIGDIPKVDCQSDFYFAYGFYSDNRDLAHIQGLACKFTPMLVMANVTLTGPELRLDVQNISYETDAIISDPLDYLKAFGKFNGYTFANTLGIFPTSTNDLNLDEFFALLTFSPSPISVPDLANPAMRDHVITAIQRQLTLIQTQLNRHSRRPLDSIKDIADLIGEMDEEVESNFLTPISPEQNATQLIRDVLNVHDAITRLNPTRGTVTNLYRVRLVQDVASTRLLQVLLGVMLACTGIVSLLVPTRAVLPREPTSVASVAALLADGDLLDHLPADAQGEKPRDYWWSWSRGLDFRLEWREDKTDADVAAAAGGDEIGLDEYLVIEDGELDDEAACGHQNAAPTARDEKHAAMRRYGIFVIPNQRQRSDA